MKSPPSAAGTGLLALDRRYCGSRRERQANELAEICKLSNEGHGGALLPTAHCERTTRLCILAVESCGHVVERL